MIRICRDAVTLELHELHLHASMSDQLYSDALRRHEQIHNEPRRSALTKGSRACIACATARRKCSGEIQCSGCQKRSLECTYPPPDRTRRASTTVRSPTDTERTSLDASPTTQSVERQNKPNPGALPISWSHTSLSPIINTNGERIQTLSQIPLDVCDSRQESSRFSSYGNSFAEQGPHIQDTLSPDIPDLRLPTHEESRTVSKDQSRMGEAPFHDTQQTNQMMASDSNMNLNSANSPTTWFQSNSTLR